MYSCGAGVVLCYPAPQEYMRTHWAFRKLAGLLAVEGFHVLRFDYHATGDSAGDSPEANLGQWREDIQTAVRELKDLAGVQRVSVVGLRLGAALAAQACWAGLKVSTLVLWEPVVEGRAYLAELKAIEAAKVARELYPASVRKGPAQEELLGFPFPRALRAAVEQVDLLASPAPVWKADRVALLVSEERPAYLRLRDAAIATGAKVEYRLVAEQAKAGEQLEAALLSNDILRGITSVLAEQA
jgi:uncharacterized protein